MHTHTHATHTHNTHTHTHARTHTHSEYESEHRSNEHYLGLFFTTAWEVFITAMFSFIFISLTAGHIYDFHIFTVTHKHTPQKNIKKKQQHNKKEEKQRERSFSRFPL